MSSHTEAWCSERWYTRWPQSRTTRMPGPFCADTAGIRSRVRFTRESQLTLRGRSKEWFTSMLRSKTSKYSTSSKMFSMFPLKLNYRLQRARLRPLPMFMPIRAICRVSLGMLRNFRKNINRHSQSSIWFRSRNDPCHIYDRKRRYYKVEGVLIGFIL